MSGISVTSAFARDRIEISEVMRAMETTFISARVLIVGRFGYVGVSRDRIVLWKRRFLYMSFRAVPEGQNHEVI